MLSGHVSIDLYYLLLIHYFQMVCTIIGVIILDAIRVVFRDVALPYYDSIFLNNQNQIDIIQMIVLTAAACYDLLDFITAVIILYFFYVYGRPDIIKRPLSK